MKYSVVTACLNSSVTLRRTIQSVFTQTALPSEYVFVDGGSTDGTLEMIEEAKARAHSDQLDMQVKLVHQKTRGGIYGAWNLALNEVSSDLVCFLNSDDWYYPYTMAHVLECFAGEPDAEILLGSGLYTDGSESKNRRVLHPRPFFVLPFATNVIHPACFVRKSVYDRLGCFEDKYKVSGDYEFIYRCRKARVRFAETSRVLVNVQTGGYAEQNKEIARVELAEIGHRYATFKLLPRVAYWLRALLKK